MLFVKTDELNKVVLSHTDPMDLEYGLGKTEEELREEGYLFEYLEELPRPIKKEGFRGVTYCDGTKFWFEYREAGEVDIEEVLMKVEEVRYADLKRRQDLGSMKTTLEEMAVTANEVSNIVSGVAIKNEEIERKLVPVEQGLANSKEKMIELHGVVADIGQELVGIGTEIEKVPAIQEDVLAITATASNALAQALNAKEKGEEHDVVIEEHGTKIQMSEETMSSSLIELMMAQMSLSSQQKELTKQAQSLVEQAGVVGMTEEMMAETVMGMMLAEMELGATKEKLLSTTAEMVTTKKELQDTREQLTQTQAEMAELIMMILEGGMVQ